MFKKTFASPPKIFDGFTPKQEAILSDPLRWHNIFFKEITSRIDERLFDTLFCKNNGRPNASIRILIGMMILKEGLGISDNELFECCQFHSIYRRALGLTNMSDSLPVVSTYYALRKAIVNHEKQTKENLFQTVFTQVTNGQCSDYEVNGKRIRMDSKLIGSNIAWGSRYELVHETLHVFYRDIKNNDRLPEATKTTLNELLKLDGNKVVYTHTSEEIKDKFIELGRLIYSILPLFSIEDSQYYACLKRVFDDQFKVQSTKELLAKSTPQKKASSKQDSTEEESKQDFKGAIKQKVKESDQQEVKDILTLDATVEEIPESHQPIVISRPKDEISATSVQSVYDMEATFRNKDGNKVKGYAVNVTESCDEEKGLNLIGYVDVQPVTTSDTAFFQESILNAQDVFTGSTEIVHADGAYNSQANQAFCSDLEIALFLHAIQGKKGRYKLEMTDSGLQVFDNELNEIVEVVCVATKNGDQRWRIRTAKGLRYFSQKDIDTYLARKKTEETPTEVLQKRNNVEATIFQLAYHCQRGKTRYRGLVKHQMWANARALWVNCVRIVKFKGRTTPSYPLFMFSVFFWKLKQAV